MTNVIYGVLMNSTAGARHSDVGRAHVHKHAQDSISALLPSTMSINEKDALIDFLIRLLQSYDEYETVIAVIDPVNTYNTPIELKSTCSVSFKDLYDWAIAVKTIAAANIQDTDDPVTCIQKAIISLFNYK